MNLSKMMYEKFYNEVHEILNQYLDKYKIKTNDTLNIPDVNDKLNNTLWINVINPVSILRLSIDTPLLSIRTKHLINMDTSESFINIIDFSINKIQLRNGGFGTKIINSICNLHKNQMNLNNIYYKPVRIIAFKFLSIPFQLKNNFEFRQISQENFLYDQDKIYEFSKLLVIMLVENKNSVNILKDSIIYSSDINKINDILKRQMFNFHSQIYIDNLWLKTNFLSNMSNKACYDYQTEDPSICTDILYKSIANQLANDYLCENRIMQHLWNMFYLEKTI